MVYVNPEVENLPQSDINLLNDKSDKSHKIIGLKKFDRIKSNFPTENKSLNLLKIVELEQSKLANLSITPQYIRTGEPS